MDYMIISKMPKKTDAVAPQDYMAVSKAPTTAKAPTLRTVNASKEHTAVEVNETAVSKKGTNKTANAISEQDYMAVSKAPKKQMIEMADYMVQTKLASANQMDRLSLTKQLKQPEAAISGDSKQTSAKSTAITTTTTTTTAKQPERKVTEVKSKKEKTTNEKTKKSSKTPRDKTKKSKKEKTKESEKEKESVKVIVLTKIGDAKSNKDSNDKKPRKMPNFKSQRKSLIIKLSVIIVLIILLVVAITAVTMYMLVAVTSSPKEDNTTPKRNVTIQFMNDVCNRNVSKKRFKGCWYYEKKFVDDCVEVQCRFIGLTSYIVQRGDSYKLAFKQEKTYIKVKVPDGVPCKRDGRPESDTGYCKNGICQLRRDWKELAAYEAQNETDGAWKKVETIFESCINIKRLKNFNIKYLFDSAQYNEYANCPQIRSVDQNHLCLNAAYEYRVCTLPTLGGKPCWNDENDLKLYEWPIIAKKMCSDCTQPDPNLNHNCPERKCSIMFDDKSESPLQYVQMISFETCCESGPPGQCMMGHCTGVVKK